MTNNSPSSAILRGFLNGRSKKVRTARYNTLELATYLPAHISPPTISLNLEPAIGFKTLNRWTRTSTLQINIPRKLKLKLWLDFLQCTVDNFTRLARRQQIVENRIQWPEASPPLLISTKFWNVSNFQNQSDRTTWEMPSLSEESSISPESPKSLESMPGSENASLISYINCQTKIQGSALSSTVWPRVLRRVWSNKGSGLDSTLLLQSIILNPIIQ
jgi:hypothetical protein